MNTFNTEIDGLYLLENWYQDTESLFIHMNHYEKLKRNYLCWN